MVEGEEGGDELLPLAGAGESRGEVDDEAGAS
jgi:hypothetical protein